MVNEWTRIAHSSVLPPSCILCGDRGQRPILDICSPCADDLPPNTHPCPVCAQPYGGRDDQPWPCGQCIKKERRFDRAIAPYLYDYPLDHLIHAFKYRGVLSYGRVLGTLLAQHIRARTDPLPEALIPVPLHHTRHRERGFNQAYELSRPLSTLLGIPVDDTLCHCKRPTVDQTELTSAERRRNVKGAFKLKGKPQYRHVALIDDVLTTGSTTNEIARLLKKAGVGRVEVWTIARAGQGVKR